MKKLNFDIFTRYGIIFTICFAFTITLLMISTPVVFAQEDAPGVEGPAVEDRGPPEDVGKPDDAGKPDDVGPETEGLAVEDRGPPEDVGKPDDAGKPDDVGPETEGPAVEDRGPPESVGKPDDAGKPGDAGKPDGKGQERSFGGTLESASTFGIMESDGTTSTYGKQGYAYGNKAVGTGLTVINSDKICGLSLCSEKMSTAEIIQQYLQSKGLD